MKYYSRDVITSGIDAINAQRDCLFTKIYAVNYSSRVVGHTSKYEKSWRIIRGKRIEYDFDH